MKRFCFNFYKNQILAIEIDFKTGKTKKSFEFSQPIQKLVAFSNHSNAPTLVGLADKVFILVACICRRMTHRRLYLQVDISDSFE